MVGYPFTESVFWLGCFCQTVWGTCWAEQLSNEGSHLRQAPAPLWPNQTPGHSKPKWGNHARCNGNFGPNNSRLTGPSFKLVSFSWETQKLTYLSSLVLFHRITSRAEQEKHNALPRPLSDGWNPTGLQWSRKGQPLSFHMELFEPLCHYRGSLKSLSTKDSSKCINHDINLLHNE